MEQLLTLLKKHKQAIAWKLVYIKGISPSFCTHKINLETNVKLVAQPQQRPNPTMRKVMHNETLKPLDVGIIYPISYSHWGSPMQVMPKKGCSTVVPNDKGELIPNCTVTKKVHLPLLFIDQCWNVSKGQVVLFFGWDVRVLSDSDGTRSSREDYLHMLLQSIPIPASSI